MLKNVFMKTVAVAMSLPIAMVVPATTALAQDTPVEEHSDANNPVVITEDVTVTNNDAVTTAHEANVTIQGNVSASGETPSSPGSSYTHPSWGVVASSDSKVTVEGDVSAPGYVVQATGAEVTVNGNAVSTQTDGTMVSPAAAAYTDGKITIGKDAVSGSINTVAAEGGNVTVKGDVINNNSSTGSAAVNLTSGGQVTVKGDVKSANGMGITDSTGYYYQQYASTTGVTVNVEGNVVSPKTAIQAGKGSVVTVDKNVQATSDYGITMVDNANITVNGNVNGLGAGIWVNLAKTTTPGNIDVKGSVNGFRGIYIYGRSEDFTNVQDAINRLPQITVYSINSDYKALHVHDEMWNQDIVDALENSVNYYIHSGDKVTINNNTTGKVKKGDAINVTVPEGYTVQVSSTCSLEQDSNGNYIVRLTDSKGGIDIKAIIKAVSEATGASEENITVVDNSDAKDSYGAPVGSIVIASATAANTYAAAPLADAKAPSKVLTVDTKKITSAQYKQAVIDTIKSTPAGTSFRLETNGLSVLDRAMMQTLSENPTVDMEVFFTYGGQKLRVVIPAGYNVMSLLDANGYCGFLRLAYLLGSQVVG